MATPYTSAIPIMTTAPGEVTPTSTAEKGSATYSQSSVAVIATTTQELVKTSATVASTSQGIIGTSSSVNEITPTDDTVTSPPPTSKEPETEEPETEEPETKKPKTEEPETKEPETEEPKTGNLRQEASIIDKHVVVIYFHDITPAFSVTCIAFFLHPSFDIIFRHRLSTCCLK